MKSRVGKVYCNAHRIALKHVPTDPENRPSSVVELLEAILSLEGEENPLLCYGIGSHGQSLPAMQSALLAHLQQLILDSSSEGDSVLLIGPSLERLVKEGGLSKRDVEGVTNLDTTIASLKELRDDYQLVAVEGSIRYLDQLPMFTAVRKMLRNNGSVLLFGEYLDDDSAIARSELANLSSLKQLSERLGFQLQLEEQHSDAAAAGLRLFIESVEKSREELLQKKLLTAERLDALQAELNWMRKEFATGRRCFKIFRFNKLVNPPGEYAQAEYSDIHSFEPEEVKQLFEASFGVDFDPQLWHWKYQLGQGTCVVAREAPGRAIVSHYGGAPRKIDYFGKPQMAIQPCDVMVLPEVRRQYGKNSLFFKTAATFLEREIGNTVNQLLGFGFPNQKAMNIALRLGLYEKTDDFVEVTYPDTFASDSEYKIEDVDIDNAQHCRYIENLWQAMRVGFHEGIIGVRDASYLRYRYFDHPFAARGQFERIFIVPVEAAEPLAMAVLKEHDQHRLLMDVLCPHEHLLEVLALISHYSHFGSPNMPLKLWITRAWLNIVEAPGSTVNELGIEIPCNSWNPGPSSTVLYGAWWLTAGDMDFM